MNDVIVLIILGLFVVILFIKKIEIIIVKLEMSINVGIIIEKSVLMMIVWWVNLLLIVVKWLILLFFCMKDLIMCMLVRFFFVIEFIWLINFWIMVKCLFIDLNVNIIIRIIRIMSIIIIYYNLGKVNIVKIKVLMNIIGIFVSDCSESIIKFWIWVMLFVCWIIRLFVESFLMLLNENVWILWKLDLWIFVLMFWVILVESIVFRILVIRLIVVILIKSVLMDEILFILFFMMVFRICWSNFGCYSCEIIMIIINSVDSVVCSLYFFRWWNNIFMIFFFWKMEIKMCEYIF